MTTFCPTDSDWQWFSSNTKRHKSLTRKSSTDSRQPAAYLCACKTPNKTSLRGHTSNFIRTLNNSQRYSGWASQNRIWCWAKLHAKGECVPGRQRLAETVSAKNFDSSFTDVIPADVESIGAFNDCGRRKELSVERIDGKPLMEASVCTELFQADRSLLVH